MFGKVFDKIQNLINIVTGIILFLIVIIVFTQVIMRYVMGHSISWSEELTRYMFVLMIYMGVHLGIRDEIQIKIDVVDLIFKDKALRIIKILQYVITFAAIVAGIVGSYYLVKVGFRATSPSLHLPMWIMYMVFPVGFTLDFIEVIRKIIMELKQREKVNG